jgi:hypothetical protein
MLTLEKDFDTWTVEHDFGSGVERYTLQYLHGDKFEEISKKHKDPVVRDEAMLDYALVDWHDSVLGRNGKKAICNKANKAAFLRTSKQRAVFLITHAQIGPQDADWLQDLMGNSRRPSGTSSPMNGAKPNQLTAENV